MGSDVKIRRAKSGDEEQLARVHVKSWQEAYAGLVPQAYLDQLPSELDERIGNWKKTLENPKRFAWVAEGPNGIFGFVLFGLPRDPNREGFIELGAIYLLASEKGKGVGFSLLSAGFNKMKDLGYKKAYCWVLENNPTIKFYERSGATFSGHTKDDEIGGKHFKELAYDWDSLSIGDSCFAPMKNIELVAKFWNLFSEQKWDEASKLLHQDFVATWPQSRERIVGSKNFIDVNRYYPGNHKIEILHSFELGDKVLTTVWIEADTGQKTFANSIFDLQDGKIIKAEEYWAAPYAAPDWRKKWVETY